MLLNGFMKIVICFDRTFLAIIVCTNNGRAGKGESTGK
jgi:hypothetical protein